MSSIVFNTIDETFPIAGRDNNSQGFRDNFNIIKDALSTAKTEITSLENNTAKTNDDNDFNGVIIGNAEIRRLYHSVENLPGVSSDTTIDTRDADMFNISCTGNTNLILSQWPADNLYRKIFLHINTTSTEVDFTVNITSSSPGGVTRKESSLTLPFNIGLVVDVTHIFEVSTLDGGDNIFVKHVGTFS
jgi:hypothetical protein